MRDGSKSAATQPHDNREGPSSGTHALSVFDGLAATHLTPHDQDFTGTVQPPSCDAGQSGMDKERRLTGNFAHTKRSSANRHQGGNRCCRLKVPTVNHWSTIDLRLPNHPAALAETRLPSKSHPAEHRRLGTNSRRAPAKRHGSSPNIDQLGGPSVAYGGARSEAQTGICACGRCLGLPAATTLVLSEPLMIKLRVIITLTHGYCRPSGKPPLNNGCRQHGVVCAQSLPSPRPCV